MMDTDVQMEALELIQRLKPQDLEQVKKLVPLFNYVDDDSKISFQFIQN